MMIVTTAKQLTLWDLVDQQVMSHETAHRLVESVRERRRILVVGLPGTGKATLLKTVFDEALDSEQSMILMQSVLEWSQVPTDHYLLVTGTLTSPQIQVLQGMSADYVVVDQNHYSREFFRAIVRYPYSGLIMTWHGTLEGVAKLLLGKDWDTMIYCAWNAERRRMVATAGDIEANGLFVPWPEFAPEFAREE